MPSPRDTSMFLAVLASLDGLDDRLREFGFYLVDFERGLNLPSGLMTRAGLKPGILDVEGLAKVTHPDDIGTYRSIWDRVWEGQEDQFSVEFRVRFPEDSWLWIETIGMVFSRRPDGTPGLLIGLDRDISARTSNAESLQDELDACKDRLLRFERLREAEHDLAAVPEDGRTWADILATARRIIAYDLLRFHRYQNDRLEVLACEGPCAEPAPDASLALRAMCLPIPRIEELSSDRHPYRAWLGLPLWHQGEPFAMLEFFSCTPGAYQSSHIWSAKAWGEQIGKSLLHRLELQRYRGEAHRDPLSGLYNRRHVDHLLTQGRNLTSLSQLSLVLIDIDHFKDVNDRNGHDVGDTAIAAIAGLMRQIFRQGDVLCRFGGDEFLAILPDAGPEQAWNVAERFRAACERTTVLPGGQPATVSCGVAGMVPFQAAQFENLFKQADQALYQAKEAGRNRVSLFGVPEPGK